MTEIPAKCIGWSGHRFEARYDKGSVQGAPSMNFRESVDADGLALVLEQYRPITYVRDICIRCGATVEKPHK